MRKRKACSRWVAPVTMSPEVDDSRIRKFQCVKGSEATVYEGYRRAVKQKFNQLRSILIGETGGPAMRYRLGRGRAWP